MVRDYTAQLAPRRCRIRHLRAMFAPLDLMVALPISPTKAFMMTRSGRSADALRAQVPKVLLQRLNESSLNNFKARIYATDQSPWRFLENRFHLLHRAASRSEP